MDPFKDMDEMFRRLTRNIDFVRDGHSISMMATGSWMPPMDVTEQNDTVTVQLDVPGVRKEDLDVHLTNNRLCVSGSRGAVLAATSGGAGEARGFGGGGGYGVQPSQPVLRYMLERPTGHFERCIQMAGQVREDSIEADMADGVLKIVMQKAGGKASKASINVK
jgi:HSP20 family protein